MPSPRVPPFALVVVAVAVMAGCVWLVGHTQRNAATRSFTQTEHAQTMLTAMLDQETGLRGYLLNGGRTEFITPFTRGGRDFARALASARRGGDQGGRVAELLDHSEAVAAAWRIRGEAALRRTDRVPLSEAVERKALMEEFRRTNDALRLELERRRSAALSRASTLSAALILLLAAAFGGLGWLFIGRPVAAQRRREARRTALREQQTAFGRALQMAASEPEAHQLVKRHLESSVEGTVVKSLCDQDALAGCLSVRLSGPHEQGGSAPDLLRCEACGKAERERSVCTPLLVSGEVIGTVRLAHDDELTGLERDQVADTVTQAGPVISNLRSLARAELQAATDALTGLANRRSLDATLRRMLAQAERTGGSLSAVALDLDHFKQINDTHGHDKGDEVLAATATALTGTLRVSDFVARSGGEEFVVLLPDTGLDGAFTVAENLRAALQAMAVPGLDRAVTGSFGVAVHPEDAADAETLLRRADQALYLAKRNGRNRVEAAVAVPIV